MRFAARLTLFFAVTLVAIQAGTIWATHTSLHDTLMAEGRTQVAAAENRFVRQLAELEGQLVEGVRLLTLDFALRVAIADHDAATVVSALRNHGHRIGASRMMLIMPNGAIEGDTDSTSEGMADGRADAGRGKTASFPYLALLDSAAADGRAGSVAVIDGKAAWLAVVPVMAPDLIAFVAAALPLDDARLTQIRELAGVPGHIGLVRPVDGTWRLLSGEVDDLRPGDFPEDDTARTVTGANGDESVVITRALETPPGDPPIRVVLDYSLSDVLRRYQRVSVALLSILIFGLAATLLGATVISRGVARPIERLARYARRIAEGDYTPPPALKRRDELGQLSEAFRGMTHAIAEREDNIRHQATHDPITGLANRAAIAAALDAGAHEGHGAVLAIGLTRWRDITSTVGREMGDRLLRDTAARLRVWLSGVSVPWLIAHIGESTFAVLLADISPHDAAIIAGGAIEAFDTPWREAELTIDSPVAVGVSAFPGDGVQAAPLLRRAEVALAAAVNAEHRVVLYHPDTDPHRPERLSLMSDLRLGLTRGEFDLRFQPKLDLRTGRISGAEALVRWRHPTRGLVMPDDFIALAEETGNVQRLTLWALRTGLREARRWLDHGLPMRVAVNVSVRDLADDTLPARVAGLLRDLDLPMRALVLEITESAIMGEPDAAIAVLRDLDALGIDLAIDDFGVGQSSLAYLRRLPVREIKLDKAFVLRLPHSPDDQTIVRSVTELGHGLGYRVTAEGVEDLETLRLLRSYGCDFAQGYFIGRPLEPEGFLELAATWRDPTGQPTEAVP